VGARWIAAGVEASRIRDLSEAQQRALMDNMRLAEHLGAETVTLAGDDVAEEIVRFARSRNVTRVIIGKSREPRWRRLSQGNIVDRVLRLGGNIDVYIIHGVTETAKPSRRRAWDSRLWARYAGALGVVLVAALVAWLFREAGLSQANQAVVFLPAVVLSAMWWELGPGIFASVASVLLFDFLLVPPRFTLAVRDIESLITLLVMAGVALLVGTLAARLRRQIRTSRAREERLDVLFRLSRALVGTSGLRELLAAAEREVASIFSRRATILLPKEGAVERLLSLGSDANAAGDLSPQDQSAAAWSFKHNLPAGRGTNVRGGATSLFLPIDTIEGVAGVLAVEPGEDPVALSLESRHLLETVAAQIGAAMERHKLFEERSRALVEAETERLRSSLLTSVSHDLRTPLAVIAGASSTLIEMAGAPDPATQQMLLNEVYEESNRLARLVDNLLTMTRLDSGVAAVDKQWFPLEDVVGSALGRLRKEIGPRSIKKNIPADLPLIHLDGVMIEQVLFNLVENALKYSPEESPIEITARMTGDEVIVEVADRGPGLAGDEANHVFEKLYRGSASRGSTRGAGLGLAIGRAIVEAHGGRMGAANRTGGGSAFWFSLPVEPPPADLAGEDEPEECS
jgi:two-component system sensor histidine kinase KdpD